MSALPADLASAASATPRSTISNAPSTSLVAGGNGPAPIALDLRPTSLHESALSPAEHAVFPIWLSGIRAAPSGQPGLYDEQDALTFLRRDCGVDMEDEIQILSLFERTPRGMTAGHLYALMRLASWVKAGQTPSRRLLFTQAPPLKLRKVPPVSPPKPMALKSEASVPARYPTAAPFQTSAATTLQRSTTAMASSSRDVLGSQSQFEPRNKPTPALPPSAALSAIGSHPGITPHPPASSAAYTPRPGLPSAMATPAPAPVQSGVDVLLGFDPAPNPFKQAAGSAQLKQPQHFQIAPAPPPRPQQPRIVKPTPVVASAAGASNPFRSASMSIPRSAPMYGVSVSGQSDRSNGSGAQAGQGPFANSGDYSYSAVAAVAAAAQAAAASRPAEQAEPPLPTARSSFGGGEAAALGQLIQTAAPPPLPARVHPLIQAGLYASSEVRKRKEALPPKTFSVIQSSKTASSKSQPRLLTGEAAPKDVVEMLPPPQHLTSAKKRAAAAAAAGGTNTPFSQRGTESRRSVSDVQAFLRRHSGQDADGHPLTTSDLGRTRSRGAMSGIGPSDDGLVTAVAGGAHGAATVVPGSTSGAKTTLLGNPATYAPKASYAHVPKTKASLPAWLREQEELQRSSLLSDDPERPPTNPRSPFSASHTHHTRSQSTTHHHTPSSSNGHGRRSFHATGSSAANRNSMISALDSAVLEDGEDEDEDEEGDEQFVDAPAAKLDSVAIAGDEISEKARSAATSIERPHNPFSERALGKGHPSTTLVTEPGGTNLARPLGRSKTLHGKGPPPPPPAPPRRRLDSSPAAAIEPPDFAPSGRSALPPPPQRSPTVDLRRGGSTRVSSAASHGRYPTDEGPMRVNAKRTGSMSWRRSGDQSPNEADGSGRGGLGSNAGTTGSQRAGVGANIKEKVSDLFRQTIGADGPLSRDYSGSNGNGETGGGGFGSFLTKPSPKGERPLDLLQQDIAAVVERHSWLSRAAEKAKGRPITEGRRGLMSERDEGENDDGDRRHPASKFSDGPQPDRDASFDDDDDVAPDTTEDHRPPPPIPASRRSGTFRRSTIDASRPGEIGSERSPFGDFNEPTDGYARLS